MKIALSILILAATCLHTQSQSLLRSTPQAEKFNADAVNNYLAAVKESKQDLHSLMILRHGKVIAETWLGDNAADKPHILNSVSKTFTATAIGFLVSERKLKLSDKVISFFPEYLPDTVSQHLKNLEVKHLLTMSVGHDVNKMNRNESKDWIRMFLSNPITEKPGSQFAYNSMATYMLSAIVQKITGQKLIDYLTPRLFQPLGITGARWEEDPQGKNNTGGWGLFVKTEDMAKLGQFILQKGKWNGKQLLPKAWFALATSIQIESLPAGVKKEDVKVKKEDSDWLQGYGYQMWMCRYDAYRADGARGQFIIIMPKHDAVIVATADIGDMQAEINLIWKYLLPAFM